MEAELDGLLLRIPNPADPDSLSAARRPTSPSGWGGIDLPRVVPIEGEVGADAAAGPEAVSSERKPHWEVAEDLEMFDLERGAKIAGSGFPVYRGHGAALQRALINLFLETHVREHGMTEIWPPAVVNADFARGTGQIPDKEDQMYVATRDECTWSPPPRCPSPISTGTRSSTRATCRSAMPRIRPASAARPARPVAIRAGSCASTSSTRSRWCSSSGPTIRSARSNSSTAFAEVLLQRLGLAYRVLLMSTREIGFVQAKKYDVEVWAPGVERWLEVSSCSNFRDYQARRMAIRYRPSAGAKPDFVHTLNGSGLALPRVVAALLETYQEADGSLRVPDVLRSRLGADRLVAPPRREATARTV